MNKTLVVLYFVFFGFLAFTAYSLAVSDQPFVEWAVGLVSVPATAQVVLDLYIACGLILAWMFHDSRKRGKSVIQWFVFACITLVAASIGPLLYLTVREHQKQN
ncbi:MAG: DUF2834 domain-containing protein [Pseudomonadales bacterium]